MSTKRGPGIKMLDDVMTSVISTLVPDESKSNMEVDVAK